MFSGRSEWAEIPNNLAPLIHQFPRTLLLLALNFVQLLIMLELGVVLENNPDALGWVWMSVILYGVFGVCDCLVFVGTWLICMTDREAMDDLDFDF